MSPILGLSLASVVGQERIFRHALWAVIQGVMLAILLSWLLSSFARALPFDIFSELPGEVVSRTHPTPFDLIIALAGGTAAAYALVQPQLSAALPGSDCHGTRSSALHGGDWTSIEGSSGYFRGFTVVCSNLVAISNAGILVFAALGFHPLRVEKSRLGLQNGLVISA